MSTVETKKQKHWAFKIKQPDMLPPPGPLAEHVDPQLALNALRHNMTLRKPEGHFHSAWTHVEYALNQTNSLDIEIRKKYISDTAYLLGGILANPSTTSEGVYVGALTLSAYLPLFAKRATQAEITSGDCQNLYESLGSVIDQALSLQENETGPWRLGELMFDACAARTGQPELLLYPSSPREEACSSQPLNHDRYFIRDNDKAPIQLKLFSTEKMYNHPIITLVIMPILDNALCTSGYDTDGSADTKLSILLEAIVRESGGEDISLQETTLLNRFSRSVASRFRYVPSQRTA